MVSPRFLTFQRVWKTSDSRGCISYRWLDNTSLSTAQSYTTLEEQDLFESSLKIMFVISSELFQRNDLTTCEYYFVIFTPSGLHTTGASVWWSSSWCVIYAGMTNNCCLMYVIGNTGHSHPPTLETSTKILLCSKASWVPLHCMESGIFLVEQFHQRLYLLLQSLTYIYKLYFGYDGWTPKFCWALMHCGGSCTAWSPQVH